APPAPHPSRLSVILPQLPSAVGPPPFSRAAQPPVQALEQRGEHRRRYPHHAVRNLWPHELAALEAFVHQHQARSIPHQNLDPVRPFRPEHEGRTTERIETKHLLHLRSKPIVPTAEVDGPRRDVNLQFGAGDNHRDARTARITRDSCSPSIAASVRTTTSPIAISSLTAGT